MTAIANAAYMGGTGTLTVDSDDYTAAVTGFVLTPTAPSSSVTDIGGVVTNFAGKAAWAAQINYNQDWKTPASFSQKLIEWHGQTKTMTYTPQDGGTGWTITVVVVAGPVGGDGTSVHAAQVTLAVNGQPTAVPVV